MKKKHFVLITGVSMLWKSQLFRKMRATLFVTIIFISQVLAVGSYSQTTRLDIDFSNATIKSILSEIEDQSEFYFMYEAHKVDVERRVSVSAKNKLVTEILNEIFDNTNIVYKINNRQIALTNIAFREENVQQLKTITGTITNSGGESIPGVSVSVKGTTKGTVSDINGVYTLTDISAGDVLVFSFIGLKTQEVVVRDETTIDIIMAEEAVGIDEVVVTALGITREKKSLGYSVGEVGGDELTETSQGSVLNAVAGKAAGVQVSQMYGLAGSSVNMVIRGASSLNTKNQPLFVIDGVPVDNGIDNNYQDADMGNAISDLNTEDIESMSILKGPSAAALYGSRAGNGVVIITTKSGKGAKKGIGVSFNSSFLLDDPYHFVPFQSKFASGKEGAYSLGEQENESWGAILDGTFPDSYQWDKSTLSNDGTSLQPLVAYPDRQQNFYQNGFSQSNNLAFDGKYEKANFRVSIGNLTNEGILPNTDYSRKTIGMNGSFDLTDNLKVSAVINISEAGSDNRQNISTGRRDPSRSVLEMGVQVNILDLKDYWLDGQENIQQRKTKPKQNNPYFNVYENLNGFKRNQTMAKLQLDWEVFKDLSFMVRYLTNVVNQRNEAKVAWSDYDNSNGAYSIQRTLAKEENWEGMFTYNKSIIDGLNLTANVGGNLRYNYDDAISNQASQLVLPGLFTISNGVPGTVSYNSLWAEKAVNSIYGSVSLGYQDMIYLDLTARNDWSSTLPKDNRSYFYPSASLSFLVNELFQLPSWVDIAKLRAGYAQVGNDVGSYALTQYYATAADWGEAKQMYMPGTLRNSELKPEIATSKEIGLDLSFLKNRINLDATYYVVDNKNQVLSISIPNESGATAKQINAGLVQGKGWDVSLNTDIVRQRDFSAGLGITLTRNRTKIVELADGISYYQFGSVGEVRLRSYVGDNIGNIYAYPYLKVEDEESEYYNYPIIASNGRPQKDNREEKMEKVGNFNHKFLMGIQPTIRYKNFSLFANFDWRAGGEFYSRTMEFFRNNGWLEETFSGVDYDRNKDIVQQIKDNPDKYFNLWVGGRTGDYGGFEWPDEATRNSRSYVNKNTGETVYVNDASFIPGVREDGNGGYIENLGGDETVWMTPFEANKRSTRYYGGNNIYSASYVKLRELSITYKFPQQWIQKAKLSNVSLSFIAQNVFTWTKAKIPVDPELAFISNGNTWIQGAEYYNVTPWTRSYGVKLNVEF
ncbi:SusC/RagA family TonB-linked outer membrane protein [Maribellus comscasis]|uniref:SusC/RagA family TonB-linked outer membrane protein n=2 Tax=Maribellus comscasis TaxID=2681766 RepID=A0A6I6K5U6_9BACT|nr:SusC/RagA family TonB-linked outer membrane protein [Maribellus comscasis]